MTRTSRLGKRLNETGLSIFLMDPRSVIRYSEYVRNVSDETRKRSETFVNVFIAIIHPQGICLKNSG